MSRVTVIIPAYNPGRFLMEGVNGVIRQSYQDWQLLIVDDGSTEWPDLPDDPRIEVLRKRNEGTASARNVGMNKASGEFVAFLDADDLWAPTKLQRQVDTLDEFPAIRLCTSQFAFIDAEGAVTAPGYGRPMSRLDLLETGDGILTSGVLIRNGPERFRSDLKGAEDFDMWLRLSGPTRDGFVPTVESFYRRHTANRSTEYQRVWRGIRQVYQAHPHPAGKRGLSAYRKVFAYQAWDAARADTRHAPLHILRAATLSPSVAAHLAMQTVRSRL